MSRLPINPAFDRSSNTHRGLRLALAVGLGTLALGLAAGAVAAAGNQVARIAHVRHVDTGKATAPSALRAGDLFSNPTMAPDDAAAPAAPAAAAPAAHSESSESENGQMSTEHKNGVPPLTDDHQPGQPTGSSSPRPRPHPSAEPSHSPEPNPSPND